MKFEARREILDWRGKVSEEVVQKDFEWKDCDPRTIVDAAVSGNTASIPSPVKHGNADIFYNSLFRSRRDVMSGVRSFKSLVSVPVYGVRFVVYDKAGKRKMQWEDAE